jgi:hypothetical protein
MAQTLMVLREYASNELQRNVIKSLYKGVTAFTKLQTRRVYADLLEAECKSIMNYEFDLSRNNIRVFTSTRKFVEPIHEIVKIDNFLMENDKIIKRFINTHKDEVCQKVLQEIYPGIEFKKFLEGDLECHFQANQNPTKLNFYYLPKLNVSEVINKN